MLAPASIGDVDNHGERRLTSGPSYSDIRIRQPVAGKGRSAMPGKTPDTKFPDQAAKLRFLLDVWGDQRKADLKKPNHVLQVGADGRVESVPRIDTQADLARAIEEEPTRLNPWMRGHLRIPPDALDAICRLYAVDVRAFRILSPDDFTEVVRTGIQWPAWSRWRSLLAVATPDGLRLIEQDPASAWPGGSSVPTNRFPRMAADDSVSALPVVPAEASFWLGLSSPPSEVDSETWAWTGWHLLILSLDCRTDRFANLSAVVPGAGTFPATRTLYLPSGLGLRHDRDDLGAFEIVAVLSRSRFPDEIVAGLSAGNGEGLLIEPALHKLALWLKGAGQDAAWRSTRYRAVPARAGTDGQASMESG